MKLAWVKLRRRTTTTRRERRRDREREKNKNVVHILLDHAKPSFFPIVNQVKLSPGGRA